MSKETMPEEIQIDQLATWTNDDNLAAIVIIEPLQPAAEGDAVIFPPTYAPEESSSSKKSEYVIDTLKDGRNVCQIDSVGSQANRLEPIFKTSPYDNLVPQVTVEVAGGQKVNLLDAGHRAADAIVRFSTLHERLTSSFEAWLKGDSSKLATIAPTSLLFGAWDSRETQAKTPRILSSIIRAYDVELLSRSAQYVPALEYTDEVLGDAASLTDKQKSELGLTHVPAPKALGGVLVRGEIQREAILNLVSLRTIGALDEQGKLDADKTQALRRYILGLALVVATKPLIHNLRQGCLLVGVESKPAAWKKVYANGKRVSFQLSHDTALKFAERARKNFSDSLGIEKASDGGFPPVAGQFDPKLAKAATVERTAKKEAAKTKKGRGTGAASKETPPTAGA